MASERTRQTGLQSNPFPKALPRSPAPVPHQLALCVLGMIQDGLPRHLLSNRLHPAEVHGAAADPLFSGAALFWEVLSEGVNFTNPISNQQLTLPAALPLYSSYTPSFGSNLFCGKRGCVQEVTGNTGVAGKAGLRQQGRYWMLEKLWFCGQ